MRTRIFSDSHEEDSRVMKDIQTWRGGRIVRLSDTTAQFPVGRTYSYLKDVVTPGFLGKRNAGIIINNPMVKHHGFIDCRPLRIFGEHVEYNFTQKVDKSFDMSTQLQVSLDQYRHDRVDLLTVLTDLGYDSFNFGLVINNAWANVSVSEMQALASLGELPETLKWVQSVLQRGITAFRKIRKLRKGDLSGLLFHSSKSAPKGSADAWMEARYAIRPLIGDMQNALNALSAELVKGSRSTARAKDRLTTDSTTEHIWNVYADLPVHYSRRSEMGALIRAGVLYELSSEISNLASIYGLNQVCESMWELVPMSFILDWFANVGNTIAAWTPNAGLHDLSSWCTLELYNRETITPLWCGFGPWYTNSNKGIEQGNVTLVRLLKFRIPNPNRQILPSFDLKLNTAKLLDLSIILKNLIR